jgi:hypothetical protein
MKGEPAPMQGRRIRMVLTACRTHDRSDLIVQVINDGLAHVQIRITRVEEANTVAISVRMHACYLAFFTC